ncbi:28S ribosomal protein S36, mitochondrial isoform X3 [Eleginops maclovinus]|uniref:28S ribosomal protein S36, mitochondrial isoform X3 n=2 Tax=Eleginops maclovinus TaxID=56733 RepID=UPI003080BF81
MTVAPSCGVFQGYKELLFLYRKYNCEVVMGSKVSSKMAAPAARVIQQAIRPHAPLIKFPNRQDFPRPNVEEVLKMLSVNTSPHNAPAPPPVQRPHVPLTPISGKADTLASIQLLPARYRRRPMTMEEMDYIQRGGPE